MFRREDSVSTEKGTGSVQKLGFDPRSCASWWTWKAAEADCCELGISLTYNSNDIKHAITLHEISAMNRTHIQQNGL
jgi:hypothetical protein